MTMQAVRKRSIKDHMVLSEVMASRAYNDVVSTHIMLLTRHYLPERFWGRAECLPAGSCWTCLVTTVSGERWNAYYFDYAKRAQIGKLRYVSGPCDMQRRKLCLQDCVNMAQSGTLGMMAIRLITQLYICVALVYCIDLGCRSIASYGCYWRITVSGESWITEYLSGISTRETELRWHYLGYS